MHAGAHINDTTTFKQKEMRGAKSEWNQIKGFPDSTTIFSTCSEKNHIAFRRCKYWSSLIGIRHSFIMIMLLLPFWVYVIAHKTKGCHRVVIELSLSCHLLTTLGWSGLYLWQRLFLVVPVDNLDNFSDDNHKVVIVTIRLTTVWQLFVLCEGPIRICD